MRTVHERRNTLHFGQLHHMRHVQRQKQLDDRQHRQRRNRGHLHKLLQTMAERLRRRHPRRHLTKTERYIQKKIDFYILLQS